MKCYKPLWARFINFLLEDTDVMGVLEDINDAIAATQSSQESQKLTLDALNEKSTVLDQKLDEVRALIESLQSGGGISESAAQQILSLLTPIKEDAATVSTALEAVNTAIGERVQEADDLA